MGEKNFSSCKSPQKSQIMLGDLTDLTDVIDEEIEVEEFAETPPVESPQRKRSRRAVKRVARIAKRYSSAPAMVSFEREDAHDSDKVQQRKDESKARHRANTEA